MNEAALYVLMYLCKRRKQDTESVYSILPFVCLQKIIFIHIGLDMLQYSQTIHGKMQKKVINRG